MLAECLIGDRPIEIKEMGIRPGEKVHEILVADDEAERTVAREKYYAIRPALPQLADGDVLERALKSEYSSRDNCMNREQTLDMLRANGLFVEDEPDLQGCSALASRWARRNPMATPTMGDARQGARRRRGERTEVRQGARQGRGAGRGVSEIDDGRNDGAPADPIGREGGCDRRRGSAAHNSA